jgi:hypothetical protein
MLGSWGTADPRRLLLSLFFERRERLLMPAGTWTRLLVPAGTWTRLLVPAGTWTPVEEMSSPGAMPEEPRVGRHYGTTGPLERSNCRIHLRGRCRDDPISTSSSRRRGSDIGPLISTPAPKMDSTARPLQRAGGNRMCYLGTWGRTAVMLRNDRRKLNLVDRRRRVRGALLIAWSWL